MARTLQEIRQLILDEVNLQLPELNEVSSKADYQRWINVLATFGFNAEEIHDLAKADLQTLVTANRVATSDWYQEISLLFQLGDSIVKLANGNYGYATIDSEKQIIAFAAVQDPSDDSNFNIDIKVSKLDSPLDSSELSQFAAYIELLKIAGTTIRYISQNPDSLDITADVITDSLRSDTDIQTDIETALDAFYQNLPFNGELRRSELVATIKTVSNVTDVFITNLQATPSGDSASTINRSYIPVAGRIETGTLTFNFNV